MQLGISSWAYPWAVGWADPKPAVPMTAMGLLEKARDLGVGLVQIADNFPLDKLTVQELKQLRDAADAWGIALEVGTRGIAPAHLLKFLGIARILCSSLVRTLPGLPGKYCPEPAEMIASINEVLPEFIQAGVKIALENHEPLLSSDFAWTVKQINHPNVGVTMDLANVIAALEAPQQAAQNLVPYIVNLHIKEFDVVRGAGLMGLSVIGRPAGQGKLRIEWLMELIEKAGKTPTVVIELWTPFVEDIDKTVALEDDWACQSIAYLKTLRWFQGNPS